MIVRIEKEVTGQECDPGEKKTNYFQMSAGPLLSVSCLFCFISASVRPHCRATLGCAFLFVRYYKSPVYKSIQQVV